MSVRNQKGARDVVQRAQTTWVKSPMWLKIGWCRPVTPALGGGSEAQDHPQLHRECRASLGYIRLYLKQQQIPNRHERPEMRR